MFDRVICGITMACAVIAFFVILLDQVRTREHRAEIIEAHQGSVP